jgi:3-phosphoglycerate kinase
VTEKDAYNKLSVRDLNLAGKRLFMRVDFNVPLDGNEVADDTRIRAALPSIRLAKEAGAKVILASHLGRPKGERKPEFSLRPAAICLAEILSEEVLFAADCVGDEAHQAVERLNPGGVLLLENVRYYNGETKNDPEFADRLSTLADEYVNDAFGTSHRAHASTVGVPTILGKGAVGLLIEKELQALSHVLYEPAHPVVAIFGGAKVSDKIEVIENFLGMADTIILGGGMAFTFYAAQGKNVGKSLLEVDKIGVAEELLKKAEQRVVELVLPVDVVVAPAPEDEVETQVVDSSNIPEGWMGLDVGPSSVDLFGEKLEGARTVIWNGPLGVFELAKFAQGTLGVAKLVAGSDAFTLVGGGDSVSAVKKAGVADRISHVSTGGGASLQFLAGKQLPGIAALTDKEN